MQPLIVLAALAVVLAPVSAVVPLLAWSSQPGMFNASALRLGKTSTLDTIVDTQLYQVLEKPSITCYFVQDKMSAEDLTRFGNVYGRQAEGGVFSSLKAALETAASSLVVPAVDSTAMLEEQLQQRAMAHGATVSVIGATELTSPEATESLAASKAEGAALVVVHLPAAAGNDRNSVRAALDSNDKLIAAVLRGVGRTSQAQTGGVTVLLSSLAPSDLQLSLSAPEQRSRRSAESGAGLLGAGNLFFVRSDSHLWFTIPILMGLGSLIVVLPIWFIGTHFLMITQTPDRFAEPTDACLQVPLN